MTKRFLQHLPLTYVDSISFENVGAIFSIKMVNREHHLVIFLRNILALNFSQESLSPLDPYLDYVELIGITHEYRKVNHDDLKKYSYSKEEILDNSPLLHIITLYGNNFIEIICEDIDIDGVDS